MAQRVKHCPNSLNLETAACEKYITRLLQREKLPMGKNPATTMNPPRKVVKHSTISTPPPNQNQLLKARPNVKQQNMPSPKHSQNPSEVLQFSDDSALVEVTVKTTNPRQRSRSTVADREPWGQLLKQHKSNEKVSMFSNFDPLRTLHFLAKELQHHVESVLPNDNSIQQIINDMQYALKRVPPEVASIVHLQQAIDLLPTKKSSKSLHDAEKPEKLNKNYSTDMCERIVQTDPWYEDEDAKNLQKVMEESTVKLEISCRQMESLCQQLKVEKQFLENQLQTERNSVQVWQKKVEDLEFEINEILNPKVKILEDEKRKLESEANEFIIKMETQSAASVTELKSMMSDLKISKTAVEQECNRLKHQIRLAAIEKEKYIAVLAVRDRQIGEIRSEMTQLQEVVNEQLMELHNNAFSTMPSNSNIAVNSGMPWNADQNKEHIGDVGDATLSSIHTNEDIVQQYIIQRANNNNNPLRDLPCGDTLHEGAPEYRRREDYSKDHRMQHPLERPDSQGSLRCMFNDLKKTAYELGGTQENHS